uniref:Uncharacterized protein n=1 Tax=Anguilla anguilla TaxID=7936 RepID=A0A0E9W803_ANGAN
MHRDEYAARNNYCSAEYFFFIHLFCLLRVIQMTKIVQKC